MQSQTHCNKTTSSGFESSHITHATSKVAHAGPNHPTLTLPARSRRKQAGASWVQMPSSGSWWQPAASPQPTWHDPGALGTHGIDWSGAQLPLDAGCGWVQGWPPQASPGQQYVWLTVGAAASSGWDWTDFQPAPGVVDGWQQAWAQQGGGYINWNGMQPPPGVCGAWAWEQASAQQGRSGWDWRGVQPPTGMHGSQEQGRA